MIDSSQKSNQRFLKEKYQKTIGSRSKGTKRKLSCSSKDDRKKLEKLEKGSKSSSDREKKCRKKDVPSSSRAARSYDMASQPGVSPYCYNSHVEQGGQQREGTSANICHNIVMVSLFIGVLNSI